MNEQNQYQAAQKSLEEAKKVLVLLPPMPTEDVVNAALSLHLSLKESGKESQIGCSSNIEVNSAIHETNQIKDSVGSRNLTISFDYHEDDLDKVDYDVRNDGKFYLVVKPKINSPVPDISNVKFSYSGAEADLVVVFGIHTLEELGKLYSDEKTFLDEANILSINNSPRPASFTCNQSLHLLTHTYVELVAQLLEKTKLELSENAANNLLFGVYDSTQNLTSSKVSADTFATVAFLMRSGAQIPSHQRSTPRFAQAPFFEIPTHTNPIQEEIPADAQEEAPIPQDWKQPKIFRAGESSNTR